MPLLHDVLAGLQSLKELSTNSSLSTTVGAAVLTYNISVTSYMHGWDFLQATTEFQDSDIFQKAIEMTFRCILSVNSHLSGFRLQPGPTHVHVFVPVRQLRSLIV